MICPWCTGKGHCSFGGGGESGGEPVVIRVLEGEVGMHVRTGRAQRQRQRRILPTCQQRRATLRRVSAVNTVSCIVCSRM